MIKIEFKIEDFIFNDSFRRYALNEYAEDVAYWKLWMESYPEAFPVVNQAREIISFIYTNKTNPDYQDERLHVYNKLQQQIHVDKMYISKPVKTIQRKFYWFAAAMVLVIGLSFLWILFKKSGTSLISRNNLELFIPEGQRGQLILPDGTKVWLNSGSVFGYPADFMQQERKVYLSGEAFFNVQYNNGTPFIIQMNDNLYISVLGTEFNVKCYNDEEIIETTLLNGSVKLIKENNNKNIISEFSLQPKEKAIYQKSNQNVEIIQLNSIISEKSDALANNQIDNESNLTDEVELITAWKNEELVFHDETFEEIVVRLERWFGVNITVNDENLIKERFTGKFVNNETIFQILDVFNRSESIQYTTKNKEIIIKKNKNLN